MSFRGFLIVLVVATAWPGALADDTRYRYEGDVVPWDESAGWIIADPCDAPCSASVENGRFVLRWEEHSEQANYNLWIARPEDPPPPPTLWVEWRFRSNNPIPRTDDACDADFVVKYGGMFEVVWMFGDSAVSFSGDDFVLGLDIDEFHTFRYESLDGINYTIAVDGRIFIVDAENNPNGFHALQLAGRGGCTLDIVPRVNEWDFVRYGTIATGETIIASDPPAGFLAPQVYPGLDRFTVTFDAANYVYIEDVSVSVSGGIRPNVIQTRRRENTEPDTVEIVLDGPLPIGQTSRFTFSDGTAVSVVEYIYSPPPSDTNGDGRVDLREVREFQNCFGTSALSGACKILDLAANDTIDTADLPPLISQLSGP